MTETHISYEVSKKLKEFLGESAPEPIDNMYYYDGLREQINKGKKTGDTNGVYYSVGPAYALHDLLSKPFCETFRKKVFLLDSVKFKDLWSNREMVQILAMHYFDGGLLAVEKALTEMMEGK